MVGLVLGATARLARRGVSCCFLQAWLAPGLEWGMTQWTWHGAFAVTLVVAVACGEERRRRSSSDDDDHGAGATSSTSVGGAGGQTNFTSGLTTVTSTTSTSVGPTTTTITTATVTTTSGGDCPGSAFQFSGECGACLDAGCCPQLAACSNDSTCFNCAVGAQTTGCDGNAPLAALHSCSYTTCGEVCGAPICDSDLHIIEPCATCLGSNCCQIIKNCQANSVCLDCVIENQTSGCSSNAQFLAVADCWNGSCELDCGTFSL